MSLTRILFISHTHAFGAFRVGSHHYAATLARRGHDVVHLSTPISLAHRATGRIPRADIARIPEGPTRGDDGVTHLVPRTTLPAPYLRTDLLLRNAGLPTAYDAVLLDQPLLWHPTVRHLAPRLVYRPTDLYPDGVKHRLQRRITTASDGIVATSTHVLDALGTTSKPTLVIENGVDTTYLDTQAPARARPDVCIYVGALDSRFDWPQLVAWATAHPDVRFVVAGPAAERIGALPANIELPGPVRYDDLPALLHGARVGMLPLSADPLNNGRSPMKRYEYLAAGLAVVSRDTPVIRPDHSAGIYTYDSPDAADVALRLALTHTSPNLAGTRRAAEESWETKTDRLLSFIAALPVR